MQTKTAVMMSAKKYNTLPLHFPGKAVIAFFCFCLLSMTRVTAQEQQHRFAADVAAIKAYDKIYVPKEHPIVFVGSSTIRKWGSLQTAFGSYNVLNRGIGGTVIDEITYYLQELVFDYQPRQVVLYVGDNDLPNEKLTADSLLAKTVILYHALRAKLPDVPLVYLSIKPSPSREKYMPKAVEANRLIKDFLKKDRNAVFADVYTPMLRNGKPMPELFLADRLHMKPEGYALWEKIVKPVLLKPGK